MCRVAGVAIEKLCEEVEEELADKGALVRAARCLLGSVTRVLLLADIVVVKQLLLAKDKVIYNMNFNITSLHFYRKNCYKENNSNCYVRSSFKETDVAST